MHRIIVSFDITPEILTHMHNMFVIYYRIRNINYFKIFEHNFNHIIYIQSFLFDILISDTVIV